MSAGDWQSLYPNMPERVARWFYTSRDYDHLRAPEFVERWLLQMQRADEAKEAAAAPALSHARELCAEEIRERCPEMETRRDAEKRLAMRMLQLRGLSHRLSENPKTKKTRLRPHAIREQAEKMLACRQHGFLYRQDGESRIAWSDKCGCTRLCPDESRAETQRLIKRYVPEILRWVTVKPWRDVHYCVFTVPNVPRGELLKGKKALMDKQRQFLAELRREGKIAGALVVQEDPLGRSPGFNVHNNVLLLCEGWIDYAEIRRRWGFNVHFQRVDPTQKNLTNSLFELVKYSAKHVSTMADDAPKDGWLFPEYQEALPLVEWDDDALREWLTVQLGDHGQRRRAPFRRVRSYGCLYRLDALRWSDGEFVQRSGWAGAAQQFQMLPPKARPRDVARTPSWYALDKRHGEGTRAAIRHVWDAIDGEKDDAARNPVWLGVIRLGTDGRYRVGSIQGNNFDAGGGLISGRGETGPPLFDS